MSELRNKDTEIVGETEKQMTKDYESENTILRVNYETGASFNTVRGVIDAGGQLPQGWRDENGQLVERKRRKSKPKSTKWNTMISERREWKDGEEEMIIQLRADGMSWVAIGELYGVNRKTLGHRIIRYKKLKNQLGKSS